MTQGKYAKVNGVDLYYEIYGTGQPLVLLHGGFGTISMLDPVLACLAENRQVVGVELQGHGHTPDADRPMSFEQMADDVAALVKQLGFAKADLMGYSLGGGVALQTGIRHPDQVRKLVLVSTPFSTEGWYPEIRAGMKTINEEVGKSWIGSPMQQAHAAVAPRPEDWPTLAGKMGRLLGQDYDWSAAVRALAMPTMIVVGDNDSVRPEHAVKFFELLGGGQRDAGWDGSGMSSNRLAILPGLTHYNIFGSPVLASTVAPFLDTPMPGAAQIGKG